MKTLLKYSVRVVLFVCLAIPFNSCDDNDPRANPSIAVFNPTSGPAGTVVTITGTGFEADKTKNVVKFNGVTAEVLTSTSTEITAKVPNGATTGKITVSAKDLTALSDVDFTVTPSEPQITISSFSPTDGKFEDEITIQGSHFSLTASQNIVKFNGIPATVLEANATQLKVKLDNGARTGKISVAVGSAIGTSTDIFVYKREWTVSDFVGSGFDGSGDGTGTEASFSNMTNIAIDSAGNVYMADELNNLIRKITPDGVVSTLTGRAGEGYWNGSAAEARFYMPVGLTVDSDGNIYIADSFNQIIRKLSNGAVSTVAGTTTPGSKNGAAQQATFNNPHGVCIDSHGNLFIADNNNNLIRKITADGVVSTFAGSGAAGADNGTGISASFDNPWALTIDQNDNLYVADTEGHKIRKITPDGVVSTLAGTGEEGWQDGDGSQAMFNRPTGISTDFLGNVYVVEHFNSTVRMITPGGYVTTIAGEAGMEDDDNGSGDDARFSKPYSITNNAAGTVFYIADQGNRKVRKIEAGN